MLFVVFGQQTQTQPATGGTGLFGGGGTGLFGAQQPQQQQQQQNSLFGKPAGTTGGLFGSTTTAPATNTFGFGNTTTQQPAAGTSLFGQGNKSIFGNTPALGQTAQQPSIFGNSLQASQSVGAPQPTLTASIDENPFGNNPLFAGLPPGPHVFSVSQNQAKKPLIHVSPRKSFYRPTTPQLTKLRGFSTPPVPLDASVNPFNRSSSAGPGSKGLLTSQSLGQSLTASLSDGKSFGAQTPGGRSSVKKLVLDKDINPSDLPALGSSGSIFGTPARNAAKGKVVFHPDLVQRAVEGEHNAGLFGSSSSRQLGSLSAPRGSIDLNPSYSVNAPAREESVVPEEPSSTRQEGEYWMDPSLVQLQSMSHDQLVSVKNFTVGRHGYGQIVFLSPVDLTTVYAISGIPEKTVLFEEGACTVYPDESQKAARGEGLNVPAEISLEKCWPKDKATRAPIKNPNDPAWQRQERKLRKMRDTEFVSFEPEKGTWTFRVPHFTRYGLGDDDDEDDDAEAESVIGEGLEGSSSDPESEEDEEEVDEGIFDGHRERSEESASPSPSASPASERRVAVRSTTPDGSPEKQKPRSNRPWAATIDLDARKVQVMQASMFHNADDTLRADDLGPAPRQAASNLTRSAFLASRNALPEVSLV